jgi:hypothetical protein
MHKASCPPRPKPLELKGIPQALTLKIISILRDRGCFSENRFSPQDLNMVATKVYGDLFKKHGCINEVGIEINSTIQACVKADIMTMRDGRARIEPGFDSRAHVEIGKHLEIEVITQMCELSEEAAQIFRS